MNEIPAFDVLLSSTGFYDSQEFEVLKLESNAEDNVELDVNDDSFDPDLFWENMKFGNLDAGGEIWSEVQNAAEQLDNDYVVPTTTTVDETEVSEEVAVADSETRRPELLSSVGIGSDEELSEMSLKALKALCRSTEQYRKLKSYRRTCLNRHYARSSRTKQQNKTVGLGVQLEKSQLEVSRLQQENGLKDATIRCLQLELNILRSLKQES